MTNKELCIKLAFADSETEVIAILKEAGYWSDKNNWQLYGDTENNFATIGNQQSRPEAALIEKLINSVDAVLIKECLLKKIDPTDQNRAPQDITSALIEFFKIDNGKLSNLTAAERTILASNICLMATGAKSDPCFTIIDKGEGQSPEEFKSTFLSIGKSNKLRIPFVQGKFNMGGTGVLQFCGKHNLQLIISKKHPLLIKSNAKDFNHWGFTIVRREDPDKGVKSSTYKYLAPNGNILRLESKSLPLFPGEFPKSNGNDMEWGSYIKLYNFSLSGLKTNILFDLNYRLNLLMPSIALPIRLYERRDYSGHTLETTLSGLSVRLEEDKRENLENGFPSASSMSTAGQKMKISIFAFKKDSEKKYKKDEGIIFTINGQTHGYITKSFFSRQAVKMSYLSDSLLVIVDCSEFEGRAREDLFMNSRDRLRSGELRSLIEKDLEDLLKNHQGLKNLREQRRREEIENKIGDSRPLAEVVERILKNSPTLSKLFIKGLRLPNPFKVKGVNTETEYEGKKFPTVFELEKKYLKDSPKSASVNKRFRIQYITDVVNDYFDRDSDPGEFKLFLNDQPYNDFSCNLWNGTATLNVVLPENVKIGDNLIFRSEIIDLSRWEPISEEFWVNICNVSQNSQGNGNRRRPRSNKEGEDQSKEDQLALPNIIHVYREEWGTHQFNESSAMKVLDSGDNGYDFFINMDNIHLLTEKKGNQKLELDLIDARYKYGMVLIGLAFLYSKDTKKEDDNNSDTENGNVFKLISDITSILSPMLLPMISELGDLELEEIFENSFESL